MSETEPTKKLRDALVCISEAARLHLALNEHSSEESVSAAIIWRYGVSSWEAKETYRHALRLLDAMPKKR